MVQLLPLQEDAPTEEDLEAVPCRDHLSYLHLVPSSHVRQLKFLAAVDERVKLVQDSGHLHPGDDVALASDLRLAIMSREELYAIVAFTFEAGRDEVGVRLLLCSVDRKAS